MDRSPPPISSEAIRAAQTMLVTHGDSALFRAAERGCANLRAGALVRALFWFRVAQAIGALDASEAPPGTTIH